MEDNNIVISTPKEKPMENNIKNEEIEEEESENSSKNQLINFFNNYSLFISETSNIIFDLDLVHNKLMEAIVKLKPPKNSSQETEELWENLKDIDKNKIEELSTQLTSLPEKKLFDIVQNIEKLMMKLMIEYNYEVKRGKDLGIIKNESINE